MEANAPTGAPASERLLSLDALRGFDMMWIAAADSFSRTLFRLDDGAPGKFLARQLEHVRWEGFHFNDLIFPLFVFLIGVSITFSLGRLTAASGRKSAIHRICRRALLLYLLGLFYYGGLSGPFDQIRLLGVLQRLALCYFFSSLLFIVLKPRGLGAVCLALLIGYWALLRFVPVPGIGAGHFGEGQNLANWFDRKFLPGRKWDGDRDPEGILSTLPAIASCLLGVLAGFLLRDTRRTEKVKCAILAGAGVLLLAAGLAWGLEFPIIKKIWTSSFVLVAGGCSALLLAGFYLVIDIWKIRSWAMPFAWIGANALTIYLLSNVVDFERLSQRLVGGEVSGWFDSIRAGLGGLVVLIVGLLICFALARFLYRRKIFLRL
jgi:predicted acyltransferase